MTWTLLPTLLLLDLRHSSDCGEEDWKLDKTVGTKIKETWRHYSSNLAEKLVRNVWRKACSGRRRWLGLIKVKKASRDREAINFYKFIAQSKTRKSSLEDFFRFCIKNARLIVISPRPRIPFLGNHFIVSLGKRTWSRLRSSLPSLMTLYLIKSFSHS